MLEFKLGCYNTCGVVGSLITGIPTTASLEHVWAKIPQFHRRLVGWVGATEPPGHNKSMRT